MWIQGLLGPEPIPSCIQYPILYRTPPSHWSLWQVCVQRSMTILQAFQLYWANPSCRPRLKTPISGPYPSLPSSLLHLVKLLLQEAPSLIGSMHPVCSGQSGWWGRGSQSNPLLFLSPPRAPVSELIFSLAGRLASRSYARQSVDPRLCAWWTGAKSSRYQPQSWLPGRVGGGARGAVMGLVGQWEVSPTSKEEALRCGEKTAPQPHLGSGL